MDVMTAVLTRRSEQILHGPSPSDEEFAYLLRGANSAPDHGRLRPWRWILLRDDDRDALGECLAGEDGPDESAVERMRAKARRAPLVAALVFAPRESGRVPEWEQLAAATCMAYTLMLLLHARDYGSIWRTGDASRGAPVRRLLGLKPGERMLGFLYIGTPDPSVTRNRRPLEDVSGQMMSFAEIRDRGEARVPVGHGAVLRAAG
ncbi:nitroreductase family protein [Streptomyces murinus]|uniref:nitroreductase family protein n=1 Tax=Streptomyces murinus TaxID=33900 RepID=UPI0038278038